MNGLQRARSAQEDNLFALLQDIFEQKIATDEATGEEIFDDEMIYGIMPDRGDPADFIRLLLQHQRYEFPIITEYRELPSIDRSATMFAGPFFSSDRFPWPHQEGEIFEPIFQVDLDLATKLSTLDVGSGLVQLWMKGGECIVRHIPWEAVANEQLAAVPGELKLSTLAADTDLHCWAAAESQKASWAVGGHQLVGTGEARLNLHHLVRQLLEGSLLDRAAEYKPTLLAKARRAIRMIEQVEISGGNPSKSSTSASFFGNYNPSNYDAGLEAVLINYQTDDVLSFGSDNGGILFYSAGLADGGCWFELEF